MNKILLIEDDLTMIKGISLSLANEKISVDSAQTLAEAQQKLKKTDYQLILLDINLPDGNGLVFCQQLKATLQCPVILLTARDLELDVVSGFSAGADDYVTKPFSLAILRARVEALLKRYQVLEKNQREFVLADCRFNFEQQEFQVKEARISFSKIEQLVLRKLLENPGQTLTRESLAHQAWQREADFIEDNALSVVVKRIRGKLSACQSFQIKTIYGIGYRLEWCYD